MLLLHQSIGQEITCHGLSVYGIRTIAQVNGQMEAPLNMACLTVMTGMLNGLSQVRKLGINLI